MESSGARVIATFYWRQYTYRIVRTEDEMLVFEQSSKNALGELSWNKVEFQDLAIDYIFNSPSWVQIYKRASKLSGSSVLGSSRIFSTIDHPDVPEIYQGVLEANDDSIDWRTGNPFQNLYRPARLRTLDFKTYVHCLQPTEPTDPLVLTGIITALAIYNAANPVSS